MHVSRRHFFLGTLALPALAAKKPTIERPNLVLFLVDHLPAWVLGCYGNKEIRTPNIDRLAATGTRFVNHSSSAPVPGLGRAVLLTGRTPMQLGDNDNAAASLDPWLAGLGYATFSDPSGALAFLDQQSPEKRFSLTIGFPPLNPQHGEAGQKFAAAYAKTQFESLDIQKTAAPNARLGREMFADTLGSVRQYASAVSAFDEAVAAIIAKLSQRRFTDKTLMILTSSCGALLGRHGLWDAAQGSEPVNLYQESVITPMIWSWPGRVPAQSSRPEMVASYDLVPTLAEALGTNPPSGNLCGRSYLLLVTGKPLPKKQPWKTTVYAHYRNTDMARVDRYKLISRDQGKGPGELYDLISDPGEKENQDANPQFMSIRNSLFQGITTWKQSYSK